MDSLERAHYYGGAAGGGKTKTFEQQVKKEIHEMARQTKLPCKAFEGIKELDDLIENLNDQRTVRLQHASEEQKLSASLITAMHKHKLKTYGDEDLGTFAEIVPGDEKVKVRSKKSKTNGEE